MWIDFPDNSAKLCGEWLRLSGIGWVKVCGSNRYAGAKVKSVYVASEDGVKWFAAIGYEVEVPDVVDNGLAIGVDMNCGQVATSTGDILVAPDMLECKAAHVVAIDPRETSRMCHNCGHVNKGNRTTQADFKCLSCGHKANADHNAALNMLARGNGASGRRGALALATPMTRQQYNFKAAA